MSPGPAMEFREIPDALSLRIPSWLSSPPVVTLTGLPEYSESADAKSEKSSRLH